MDEIPRTLFPESSVADTGKWIGRVVVAVILAEAVWEFIVSITRDLILPLLARTMGAGDVQSPLYLGKGDFNLPALLTAVLELCFAGIVAVILNSFLQRPPRVRRSQPVQPVRMSPGSPAPVQTAVPRSSPLVTTPAQPSTSPPLGASAPVPSPMASPLSASPLPSTPEPPLQPKATGPPASPKAPSKPAKPKPPKEIYYNIVGEPINPTEDD